MTASALRVGIGYDSHRLVEGRPLILGGVEIPHGMGLHGHSDADVLTHALIDALLGAAGLGDIGRHFPDTDERFRGADSIELLRVVLYLLSEKGWETVNADITLLAEKPRIAGHVPDMISRLEAAGMVEGSVNIKATRGEGMGFVGRGEGMAAMAVVLIGRRK
ncbi:MAG: 2-C-methyl-D-erythritol 2,4-cyclodiphosphate synthase [bacterium]|nr:MAG: 2-C-methyl-D-erythritol 2,4-cyclodiphosphate synthase [bacterium]